MALLEDIGERALIESLIAKYVNGIGDDCAILKHKDDYFVLTTDPVPPPAAKVIAGDEDLYWMGRLLVTINASDIAASGSKPLAFLAAIECPSKMKTDDFERLLCGIKDACAEEQLKYIGGNVREAEKINATGFALGVSEHRHPLTRRGAKIGDLIISIGQGGLFWRDVYSMKELGHNLDKKVSRLFCPTSQSAAIQQLVDMGLISAAMDTSDGLYPTLKELAHKNGVGIEINYDSLKVPNAANIQTIEQWQMWLGWGDWTIIGIVPLERESGLMDNSSLLKNVIPIGRVTNQTGAVNIKKHETLYPMPKIDSERFVKNSWLSSGIDGYISELKNARLVL